MSLRLYCETRIVISRAFLSYDSITHVTNWRRVHVRVELAGAQVYSVGVSLMLALGCVCVCYCVYTSTRTQTQFLDGNGIQNSCSPDRVMVVFSIKTPITPQFCLQLGCHLDGQLSTQVSSWSCLPSGCASV